MIPRVLGLGFVTVSAALALSAATAAQTDPSAYGQASQSTQKAAGPVPAQTPQLSQPSAAQGSAKPVSKMANAQRTLAAAKVQDMLGRPIGNIQSVQTSAAGTVTSAQVALNTRTEAGKTVTIPADQLLYDPHSRVVVAQLVQTEIDAMPASAPTPNAALHASRP